MAVGNNESLPAYTTAENILSLIDTLIRKNKNDEDAMDDFGKGGFTYNSSKSALRAFKIIKDDSLEFTVNAGLFLTESPVKN